MFQDLKGLVAVITGASRGLGRQLCLYLSGQGVKVAGIARGNDDLEKLRLEIGGGENVKCFAADIADYNAIKNITGEIVQNWGRIDILINNAGLKIAEPLEELTKEMIDLQLDTMIKGTIYATRHVAPFMMKERSGCIINITSTSALRGLNSNGVYFAAKHAQKGFADAISKYLAPYNIHVVTICPGGMDTPFWDDVEHLPHSSKEQLMQVEEISDLIGLILRGAKNTLYKQITVFPISEAEWW